MRSQIQPKERPASAVRSSPPLVNVGMQVTLPSLSPGSAVILVATFSLLSRPVLAEEARVPSIELADQFEKVHQHREPFLRPLVVVVANRQGSRHIESWVSELYLAHGEKVEIIGMADLRGVPDLMKPMLRKAFQTQSAQHPVLLDWSGTTVLGFERGETGIDIYAVDLSGRILATVSGEMTPEKMEILSTALSPTAEP